MVLAGDDFVLGLLDPLKGLVGGPYGPGGPLEFGEDVGVLLLEGSEVVVGVEDTVALIGEFLDLGGDAAFVDGGPCGADDVVVSRFSVN